MAAAAKLPHDDRGMVVRRNDSAMVDLTAEMAKLAAALGPLSHSQAPGHGRIIQFASARIGEGTSTVAREFARFLASRLAKPIWLVDLDLNDSAQYAEIAAHPTQYGQMGGAAGGSPDGSVFFTLQPQALDTSGAPIPAARYLVAHPVGGRNLWVTRFRSEQMRPGQAAYITPDSAYWDAMRRQAEVVIIDAPAAERSRASIMLAPHADATVLVVAADAGDSNPPARLKSEIAMAGGRIAGLFFNRAEIETPRLLRPFAP